MTETLTSRYEIRPASPLIGAEIEGVDLTQPVPEATAEALRDAFWTYKVLVFRKQNLPPLQHVEAMRIFDEAFDHPLWVNRHPDSRLEQPTVRTHRHTGRKGLLISSSALRLTGVTDAESKALLPFLLAHASSPNYTVSFGWKPGDFVLWDNLATWHYAVNDYNGPRAYRKVIAG